MTVRLVNLIVTCFFVSTNSGENVYPDNGWRPMSIEKVRELQRDFIKTPDLHFVKTLQNSPKRPTVMDDFENKNFVKIIQTNEINETPIENKKIVTAAEKYDQDSNEFIKIIQVPYKEYITINDTITNRDNYTNSNHQRKAKKIENSNIVVHFNNALSEKSHKSHERNVGIVPSNTYEVKENTEDKLASDQNLVNQGMRYETPKPATDYTKNNLTANLLNILANYNIRTSDNLRNYDNSLRLNSRNSHNDHSVYTHVPIKLPIRYNNANHLPIDPLLAVFLSNYGHYVPSLYGVHGGYKNLYGYLASNNIHNNKPFGSYKIFSDTNSFH